MTTNDPIQQQANSPDRRKKLIAFSLILLCTAAIIVVLFNTLWQKKDDEVITTGRSRQPVNNSEGLNRLVTTNEVLASRSKFLQQLDEQYAGLLATPNSKKQLDEVNLQINVAEEYFRGSIDSLSLNHPGQRDSSLEKLYTNIVATYTSLLQNRSAVRSLRNAININKAGLSPGQAAMLKNQNELEEKTNRIASLERGIKAMAGSKINSPSTNESMNESGLKAKLAEQENKINALANTNTTLKQDNERLAKLQADANKNSSAGEASYKLKTTSLQQQVEALDAELRLARVDCNLSRVDAGQIISTAKQRKQLLDEASVILTNLSTSNDAGIKKKAHDKITRLNQVAANSRD